jgi:hypothetical protein
MTSDISTSEVGSLNDADSIVGQTVIIATTPTRCPPCNVENGGKDDNFDVGPNIQAGDLRFQDRAGNPLDIGKCLSPWATTEYLYKWFNGTQNAVASYRKGFDKSGGHDFELEGIDGPGFELFCSKFCNSMKDVMYLTAWAITRGNEALEFFLAAMAPDQNPVDGWARPDTPATVTQSVTTSATGKRGRGDNYDNFGLLCSAISSATPASPSKKEYYQEKANLLRHQNATAAARGALELERGRLDIEREQLALKRSKIETTGLEVSTVEKCMTSAVSLWKNVKALEEMGADEETITAAKALARNAISRASTLDRREGASSNND